jgi:hypothetical protein
MNREGMKMRRPTIAAIRQVHARVNDANPVIAQRER